MSNNLATSSAAALVGLASTILPSPAGVVFSEKFESAVVVGFDDNTVPAGGNWIGATDGFGSSNRGLYNETVAWPATPAFTTPYGEQAYYLNYTNSGLTTSVGATSQTLTADVTYTLTFNTAVATGSSTYKAELVAFAPGDDDNARKDVNGTMPGTVLATATGSVATTDMSEFVTLTFTPDAVDDAAVIGQDLGIRLVKSTGSVLYDNIRLITGHDLNPSPADGEDLDAGGNVNLSWTNIPPTGSDTSVDVWFGDTSGALDQQLVDGQITSSTVANAPEAGTWYWRVDSYPDGDPNGTPVVGQEFLFTIADTDGDGLPDDYEILYSGTGTGLDAGADIDVGGPDGLTNEQEYLYGTNPTVGDTDGDNLLDGPEINGTAGLRPATNPLETDTDNDGLDDDVESNTGIWVSYATDTGTNPTDSDWDNDGLPDGVETKDGTNDGRTTDTGTDPYLTDTDNDGAGDWYEVAATFTDPNSDTETSPIPYPLPDPDGSTGPATGPVKVFIMAGQSNTVGIGYVSGGPGSLDTITKSENKFPNLVDGSNLYTERNDVIYKGVVTATGEGPLTAGQGADGSRIGPELGFGHVMGWYLNEPVLIIKASQGNRSLAWDFCPPSGPRFEFGATTYAGYGDTDSSWPTGGGPDGVVNWYAGKQYDDCFLDKADWATPAGDSYPDITNASDILDFDTGTIAGTELGGRTFEIAGFCWWQGHKDGGEQRTGSAGAYATEYENRLVDLINALRTDFNAPNAPFVVATVGFGGGGWDPGSSGDTIYNAQLAVGDPAQYPVFENNVASVDTTGYWRELNESPGGQGFHYNNNAETYMLVGDAMGRAMIDLVEAAAGPDETPPAVVSLNPANGSPAVSAGTNLVVTFNEPIAIATGNVTVRNLDDTVDTLIAINDASQVTVSGTTLTVNPLANLLDSKNYAVRIDATAIDDLAGNSYVGITDDVTWSFTTSGPDTIDPTLSSTDPANDATVVTNSDLEATFSELIAIGTGNITLRNLTDGSGGDILIDVTDSSQITVSGAVLTINPSADLLEGKDYAVQIDATAIDDLVGNSYAGITDDVTWFFSTPAPPPAGVVFFDDFEAGGNPSAIPATTGAYSNTPDVDAGQSDGNTSGSFNSALWVKASQGFGATRQGLVDESHGDFTDPVGEQGYAFRYTNSGLTTAEGVIGALTAGVTYTVTLDVVADGHNSTTPYNFSLVTFNGASRNDVRANTGATSTLASKTGDATGDGNYSTVTLIYTSDGTEGTIGQDVALRFFGATSSAIIDKVQVSATGGGGPGNSYDEWAAGPFSGPLTDPSADLDFDGGGLDTGIEWVVGGDPTDGSDDLSNTPTSNNTSDPDFFIFTYNRRDEANADSNTTIEVEYGSDLAGWTTAVPGADIIITADNDAVDTGIDSVEVKLRRSALAPGGILFARLKVTVATP